MHLHCLIPGGAFSPQGRWHPAKSTYLFPVRALSRHLRGGFVSRLRQQIQDGKLPRLKDPAQIGALLDTLMAADWVVYSTNRIFKRPLWLSRTLSLGRRVVNYTNSR